MKVSKQEQDEARATLLKWLKPGDSVYCVLRHTSASGMSRRIDLYAVLQDNTGRHRPQYLSGYAGIVLGYRRHKDGGLIVSGCGMDMGFSLVYNLGATLWPDGTPEAHGTRNGEPDRDGGYALKSEWL